MAVRRVRRIIRRIDPWTVLKVSVVFNAIMALIFVLGTWVTWSLALRRGIPDRVVDIFESLTLTITIEGELYFRIVVLLAIIGAILATAFMTLGALLYNLIADLVGGVEIAVLEETYRPASTRTKITPVAEPSSGAASPPEAESPDVADSPGAAPVVSPDEPVARPAARARSDVPDTGDRVQVERATQAGDGAAGEEGAPKVRTG